MSYSTSGTSTTVPLSMHQKNGPDGLENFHWLCEPHNYYEGGLFMWTYCLSKRFLSKANHVVHLRPRSDESQLDGEQIRAPLFFAREQPTRLSTCDSGCLNVSFPGIQQSAIAASYCAGRHGRTYYHWQHQSTLAAVVASSPAAR